ncbi:MAG: hypothetical protein FWD78_14215 [Treponema sp.]|nr:hypothetical protein [Treponema sp.]
MTSREIIQRIINHDHPPRIGFDFLGDNPADILNVPAAAMKRPDGIEIEKWGRDPALAAQVPEFTGELKMTLMGNIFGRFNQKTQGECVKGALQDGWELLENLILPVIDIERDRELEKQNWAGSGKYIQAGMPFAVWSPLRDMRHIDQALMDTILEPGYVKIFLEKITDLAVKIIDRAHKKGAHAIMIADDLGTQKDIFFGPETLDHGNRRQTDNYRGRP